MKRERENEREGSESGSISNVLGIDVDCFLLGQFNMSSKSIWENDSTFVSYMSNT